MSILDRSVIRAGKIIIKAGEEHSRAYVLQNGRVRAFITDEDGNKIVVGEYEAGRIFGETSLMVDEPMTINFEAMTDVTVVTITRQDFQEKLAKIDRDLQKVFSYVMTKLNYQDVLAIEKALIRAEIDPDARTIVESLVGRFPPGKKFLYERAILPHMNAMIKEIKDLKKNKAGEGVVMSDNQNENAVS